MGTFSFALIAAVAAASALLQAGSTPATAEPSWSEEAGRLGAATSLEDECDANEEQCHSLSLRQLRGNWDSAEVNPHDLDSRTEDFSQVEMALDDAEDESSSSGGEQLGLVEQLGQHRHHSYPLCSNISLVETPSGMLVKVTMDTKNVTELAHKFHHRRRRSSSHAGLAQAGSAEESLSNTLEGGAAVDLGGEESNSHSFTGDIPARIHVGGHHIRILTYEATFANVSAMLHHHHHHHHHRHHGHKHNHTLYDAGVTQDTATEGGAPQDGEILLQGAVMNGKATGVAQDLTSREGDGEEEAFSEAEHLGRRQRHHSHPLCSNISLLETPKGMVVEVTLDTEDVKELAHKFHHRRRRGSTHAGLAQAGSSEEEQKSVTLNTQIPTTIKVHKHKITMFMYEATFTNLTKGLHHHRHHER